MEVYLSELKCSFAFCKHQQLFLFNRLDSGVIENAAKPIKLRCVCVCVCL